MKILLAAIHYPIGSFVYIRRAFKRLGHEVRTVGPCTGPHVWGMKLQDWTVQLPSVGVQDFTPPGSVPVEDILNVMPDWGPELIVTCDSAFTLSGKAPCPHIAWGVDNHVRNYELEAAFDHLFLAHQFGSRIGEENVHWLPCAYDPELHKSTTDLEQRPHHAVLLGVMYPKRTELVNVLGQEFRVLAGTGPVLQEYTDIHNQAVVSLCVSFNGDVAQRIFESMAMGCVVFSDPCHDFEALGLEDGRHYVSYRDPQEALEKLRDITSNPLKALDIQGAGRRWVKKHTWDARAEQILKVVFNG